MAPWPLPIRITSIIMKCLSSEARKQLPELATVCAIWKDAIQDITFYEVVKGFREPNLDRDFALLFSTLTRTNKRPPSPTSPSEFLRRRYEAPGIIYGASRGVPKWFGSHGAANAVTCRDLPRALPVWTESAIGRLWSNVLPRNGRTGLPSSSFDAGPHHQDTRHQDLLAVLPWHGGRCCEAAGHCSVRIS